MAGFLSPCWSALEFRKIKLEKSSSTNRIFSLQKSISKLIFAGYTGSKNQVRNRLKIQFVDFDFYKLISQKSSTDQQGERMDCRWSYKSHNLQWMYSNVCIMCEIQKVTICKDTMISFHDLTPVFTARWGIFHLQNTRDYLFNLCLSRISRQLLILLK